MIPKWNAKEAWNTLIPFLRRSLKSGERERPRYLSTPEIIEKFTKGVVWKDIETFITERMIGHLQDLSKEQSESGRDALQAAFAECNELMNLPDSITEVLETIREEEKQNQPEPNKE